MRRRYAEEYILEKQLEDSSKYNLQRYQAMKQFQQYEKQFHFLKQRLNNNGPQQSSQSSSNNNHLAPPFPLAPPSATGRAVPGGRMPIISPNFRSITNFLANQTGSAGLTSPEVHEIILPEDEPRLFTMDRFCEICWCNSKKRETLKCMRVNQLSFIPILPLKERLNVLEM
jgi:hypothetical protein